ncbi:MAG: hypothetical protein AB7V27_11815 [Candidatus Binatia bacterium]
MILGRRAVLKVFGGAAVAVGGIGASLRRAIAGAPPLQARMVTASDAAHLQAIMSACVGPGGSFYGQCGEWTLGWAQELIARCPQTLVLTENDVPVGFFQVRSIKPPIASPPPDAGAADVEKYELQVRERATCLIRAAGVKPSAPELAVPLFQTLLYHAFMHARSIGYAYVEGFAPWQGHPLMAHAWTAYPGCELVEVAGNLGYGRDLYHLRWRLDDAIPALAQEAQLDVA